MGQATPVTPKGSIILKLLAVVFLGLLLVSILTPKAEWESQDEKRDECRLSMENLSYAIREYGMDNFGYTDDLDEYLDYIRSDSVEIRPPRYEIESLTRDPESGKDSLLLDFADEFHLSHFDFQTIRNVVAVGDSIIQDSVHIVAVSHPQFNKIPISTLTMTSDNHINVIYREKNVTDHAVLIYSESQIDYNWIAPEPQMMKSTEAVISIPSDLLAQCPISKQKYKLNVNVRSKLEGTVDFLVNKDSVDANILADSMMIDLFNHRLKTEALAEVLIIIKDDSTLIDKKDSILVVKFIERVTTIKNRETIQITGDHTINVPADSMANWVDSLRIKRSVFVAHVDSLSKVLKNIDVFKLLAPRVSYGEEYIIAKVDTVGVTIQCPIDSLFHEEDKSIFLKIFGVSTPKNHGSVANGDLSWSEKK